MSNRPNKWLDIKTYEATRLESAESKLLDAQHLDAERRTGGICSIEIKTGWRGSAPLLTFVLNRGMQYETTIQLPPEQIGRLLPILVFEAREAFQRHHSPQKQLRREDVACWGLHRCPACGVGPYGPQIRVVRALAMIHAAKTMDEMYAVYDLHIAPVFDEIPQQTRDLIVTALEARRREFQRNPNNKRDV